MVDAIGPEFVSVRGAEDLVAGELRSDDLSDDVLVGEADDQAVLGRVVLVLGLGDEALASVIVGLAGAATLVLYLVAAGGKNVSTGQYADRWEECSPEVGRVLLKLGLLQKSTSQQPSVPYRSILRRLSLRRAGDAPHGVTTYERHVGDGHSRCCLRRRSKESILEIPYIRKPGCACRRCGSSRDRKSWQWGTFPVSLQLQPQPRWSNHICKDHALLYLGTP